MRMIGLSILLPALGGCASLEDYRPVSDLGGHVSSAGSDTMNQIMMYWLEGFRGHYPEVTVAIQGKGSSTAMPALLEGSVQVGTMTREPKPAEKDKFEKKYGYPATVLNVAQDGVAFYVHKDNPRSRSPWSSLTRSTRWIEKGATRQTSLRGASSG